MAGENGDLVSSRKATASALSRVSEVDDVVVSEIRPGCPGQLSTTNETCRWPNCSIRCAGICAVMVVVGVQCRCFEIVASAKFVSTNGSGDLAAFMGEHVWKNEQFLLFSVLSGSYNMSSVGRRTHEYKTEGIIY